jgi:hypothetical protein
MTLNAMAATQITCDSASSGVRLSQILASSAAWPGTTVPDNIFGAGALVQLTWLSAQPANTTVVAVAQVQQNANNGITVAAVTHVVAGTTTTTKIR